ncbi:MAG: GNAT family N-acetyltransferase [Lachnospiraceae bacterium]|nr:GNAT family N-acetyltransferase [Lachnospiraceae bacterium]
MLIRQVGLLIEEYNETESREEALAHIRALGLSVFTLAELPVNEELTAFAFTDDRAAADRLKQAGIGFALYDNEKSRRESFPDALYAVDNISYLTIERIDRMLYRYLRLPWVIAETERCVIRETTEQDLEALYEIYSEPSITKYTEGLYRDREEELAYIRDYIDHQYRFFEFGIWSVLEKKSRRLIGRAGFSNREGFEEPELGYVIAAPYQGQGFATEVCTKLLAYGRDYIRFSGVNAFTVAENTASVRLLKRLGFVYREEILIDGKAHQRYNRLYG